MAPSAVDTNGRMTNGHKVDTLNPHDLVQFDLSLKPKNYQIKGTQAGSKVLFRDVNILDSTGRDPTRGDVYIEGKASTPEDSPELTFNRQESGYATLARSPMSSSWQRILKYEQSMAEEEP